MAHKQEIIDLDRHIVRLHHVEAADEFLEKYREMKEEDFEERYQGNLGTDGKEPLPYSRLQRVWQKFLMEERRDYILRHNNISMSDIIRIGIDKFVMANGWKKASDVSSWRNNVVRIGICPDCKDQFIPLLFQANHGLCNTCRKEYNVKAIRKFITWVMSKNQRYKGAMDDALMDFYIMFHSDEEFRHLFKQGDKFSEDMANREFEVPEWVTEEQEKRMAILQQKLLESVPDEN